MSWSGDSADESMDEYGTVSGNRFVSGSTIKWGALGTAVFSAIFAALAALWITAVEAFIDYQLFLINGLGSFFEGLVSEVLGGGAGLIVASWEAAAVQAVEAGPFAPFLLAFEAVVILIIAYAIWDRRPYA